MDEKKFEESIVLLGPKAVGKSLIVPRLQKRFNGYEVFSSDKLENYAMMFFEGDFRSINEIKSLVKSEFSDEKAVKNCKLEERENVLKRNRAYVDDYLMSLDFFGKSVDFLALKRIVRQTIDLMRANLRLSEKQQLFIIQYQKIKMIEKALENMNQPMIFDFGADIGSYIELTKSEEDMLKNLFKKPITTLRNAQKRFLEKFGTVVYLEPGIDYIEKVDPRSGDRHNKIYSESNKSYVSFANLMISMHGTFYDLGDNIFKNDNDFDPEIMVKKESLMNRANLENICDQIKTEIELKKEMQ